MNNENNEPEIAPTNHIDLEAANLKLRGKRGEAYWRGLEEIAETEEFQKWIGDEFPNRRDLADLDRRTFLKYMGASLALAGLSGCRGLFMPEEQLVPYVKQPEEELIGKSLYYATTLPNKGYGFGVLCSQREGRPIKLEGNPTHPMSLGSIDHMTTAEMLNFYDPDRLDNVINQGNISTWEQFAEECQQAVAAQKAKKGSGLRFLTENATSPLVASQIQSLLKEFPLAKWHVYDPTDCDGSRMGTAQVCGKVLDVRYDLSKANVIVALDSDFMLRRPDSVLMARQWADGRRIVGTDGTVNRLYSIESSLTITGSTADHRWPVRPSQIHLVAAEIASNFGIVPKPTESPLPDVVLQSVINDLKANPGNSVVIPGEGQTPAVHALCLAINQALGAIGKSVIVTEPVDFLPVSRLQSLVDLTNDLNQDKVDALFILGGNPVYSSPVDLNFGAALRKAKFTVHLALSQNETGVTCDWTAPMSHPLEAWGDMRAVDGTISLAQPLILPLHGAWSVPEFLSSLTGDMKPGQELLKSHYSNAPHKLDDDGFKKVLYAGFIEGSDQKPLANVAINSAALTAPSLSNLNSIELKFTPCGKIWDGSFTNNGWLRELPDHITKYTWDNILEISPAMAKRMSIDNGNMLQIGTKNGQIIGPAVIQPGQPDGSITMTLGYGRTVGGVVALADDCLGYNANLLRTSTSLGFLADSDGATITNQGGDYRFACVQLHWGMEGREIIRQGTLDDMKASLAQGKKPFRFPEEEELNLTDLNLYPATVFNWNGEAWGMTIDLTTCTGCNACVTACQAENNISVVGKDQVARAREMHWIRIDRYYGGTYAVDNENDTKYTDVDLLANPPVVFQPIMCVMCEKAPCEPVCPVAATVHSHDGLNQMVYNRCIGTRYCSDNCPYKVRRFNFMNYSATQLQFRDVQKIPLLKLLNNPEVTVRSRGVMEKCTYCVERISDARIEAKKAGLPIKDGAIVTACQQACPTKTITFGNISDKKAKVTALRQDPRSYLLLEDLNTRPRTSHMARLRNPNPEITT